MTTQQRKNESFKVPEKSKLADAIKELVHQRHFWNLIGTGVGLSLVIYFGLALADPNVIKALTQSR